MVVRIYKAILDAEEEKVLWPEVRPYRWLMKVKLSMADYRFDLQFNNDASTMLGGRFLEEWMKYIDINTDEFSFSSYRGLQYCDPATSTAEYADDFAITTGGLTELGDLVIFDVQAEKVSPADHKDYVLDNFNMWTGRGLTIDHSWIEEVGTQQGTSQRLISDLRNDIPLEANVISRASGSKEKRIDDCMPFIKSGQTKFLGYQPPDSLELKLLNTEGLTKLKKQYLLFPRGKDDALDSMAGLISMALKTPPFAIATTNPDKIIKETGNPFEREIERNEMGTLDGMMRNRSIPVIFKRNSLFKRGGRRGIFR